MLFTDRVLYIGFIDQVPFRSLKWYPVRPIDWSLYISIRIPKTSKPLISWIRFLSLSLCVAKLFVFSIGPVSILCSLFNSYIYIIFGDSLTHMRLVIKTDYRRCLYFYKSYYNINNTWYYDIIVIYTINMIDNYTNGCYLRSLSFN